MANLRSLGRFALLWSLSIGPGLAQERGPDLVLVTLDTTRADFIGGFGAFEAKTPTLDALARRGTSYSRAMAAAPLTLPSHSTLMTGLYPPQHGVRDNGIAVLPGQLKTLATVLSGRGYRTGAVIGSRVLDRRFGLARGFEVYEDRMAADRLGEYGYAERPAQEVTDTALALARGWAKEGEKPLFLWVHYYDAHVPYAAPAPYAGQTPAQAYAGEIAAVDRQVGRLLEGLPGDPSRRLIVVVGDHGEALGEHGETAHGIFVYQPVLQVPLLLAGPGIPAGRVRSKPVSLRAVASTVLELLGGRDADFGPGLEASDQNLYAESHMPASAYGWSPLRTLAGARWKWIGAPKPELYDLLEDPQEKRNLVAAQPEIATRLQGELERLESSLGVRQAEAPAPDAEMTEALESLGYASGASGNPGSAPSASALDPKDGIALLQEFREAKEILAQGDFAGARARLETLVQRSPENVPFLTHLGRARMLAGDAEASIQALKRAIELNPRLEFSHQNLAEAYAMQQRWTEAEQSLRKVIELDPRSFNGWMALAEMHSLLLGPEAELQILRQAIEKGAESAVVLARVGQVQYRMGALAEAETNLMRATELKPGWDLPWLLASDLAEKQSRLPDAVSRAVRATQANPQNAGAFLRAGRLSKLVGNPEQARQLLSRAAELAPGTEVEQQARLQLEGLGNTSAP